MTKLNGLKIACAFLLLSAATVIAACAQTFKTLLAFDSTDGNNPNALVQGIDGNFYGTTYSGGANGYGTIFKITPNGTLTTLHSFTDGSNLGRPLTPYAGPVQATNRDFYGTTFWGGAYGAGTVFKITPSGTLTTLHSFGQQPNCGLGLLNADACSPTTFVQATDKNFYGTTDTGGAHDDGTLFKITPSGTLTTLHNFCEGGNCAEGPEGAQATSLVQATDGNFYGTMYLGGAYHGGTLFKITPSRTLTTLHSFCEVTISHGRAKGCADGAAPTSLVQAADGNFYGTTWNGGTAVQSNVGCKIAFGFHVLHVGCGTVFEITADGTLTTLYVFCHQMGCPDGAQASSLVQATDGNFYGTTSGGGAYDDGTLFKITPSGTLTTLHSFDGTEGSDPSVGLLQATNGDFYGTTYNGGTHGDGTIFSLSVGLGPFVETDPTSGKVDTPVIILGNDLAGTTSVTFNGTAATFTVNSTGTAISTRVPSGATTGEVQVETLHRTLKSNVAFRVP